MFAMLSVFTVTLELKHKINTVVTCSIVLTLTYFLSILYFLFQASLVRWVTVLEAASPAEQSVGLRLSAAQSLLHSGLFSGAATGAAAEGASSELVQVHLRASIAALTLLQVRFYLLDCVF